MSLTSYRAAPPRDTVKFDNLNISATVSLVTLLVFLKSMLLRGAGRFKMFLQTLELTFYAA